MAHETNVAQKTSNTWYKNKYISLIKEKLNYNLILLDFVCYTTGVRLGAP